MLTRIGTPGTGPLAGGQEGTSRRPTRMEPVLGEREPAAHLRVTGKGRTEPRSLVVLPFWASKVFDFFLLSHV